MSIRTELNLRLPNSPGALAGVCRALFDERVNVLALSLDTAGHVRLVVDNHVHAAGALRDLHYEVAERPVLVVSVSNDPGALASVLARVTDEGINLEYAYASAPDASLAASVVLGVEDAQRASTALGV